MITGVLASFSSEEYSYRIKKVKAKMSSAGIEALICSDPANMNFVTGYDATSYYVHQLVLIMLDYPSAIWIGRKMDAEGARMTTFLPDENIFYYSEDYIDNPYHHPMEFVSSILVEKGLSSSYIGVEKDCWQFTARAAEILYQKLPNAKFVNAFGLVNNIRLIKSDTEIFYMKAAGEIANLAMDAGVNCIKPGVRDCDVAAAISHAQFTGTAKYFGDYPAANPQLPSGAATAAPHITWSGIKYKDEDLTYLEIAGCHKRYHAPLARSVSLGKPSKWVKNLEPIINDGMNAVLETAFEGNSCHDVNASWHTVLSSSSFTKDSRIGYSVGIGYPPDWGERNVSVRNGEQTILRENMCFHIILGIWSDKMGYEISETIRIKKNGPPELLTNYPRKLIIK